MFYFKNILFLLILVLLLPIQLRAEMLSPSYVIHENVNYSFDGPVISAVSSSIDVNEFTGIWNTDVDADSFVEYSADATFVDSQEAGTREAVTNHAVIIDNLAYSTTYYYRVKSKRSNGGVSISSSASFSTGANPSDSSQSSGGGGIIIIDKTDKIAPEISNISTFQLGINGLRASWETSEDATSFLEYGEDENYGHTYGYWKYEQEHSVDLLDLRPSTVYNFRVLSSDDSGNISYSANQVFTTGLNDDKEVLGEEVNDEEEDLGLLGVSQRATEMIAELSRTVSTNVLEAILNSHIDAIKQIAEPVPGPVFIGTPRIELDVDRAAFYWKTDKDSSSLVAIASEDLYTATDDEPYSQIVANIDEMTTEHEVFIYGIKPDTLYHYQLRSQANLGPVSKTDDIIFHSGKPGISITSFYSQVIDDNTAVFKWSTNKAANTVARIIPYRNNVLSLDEAVDFHQDIETVIHEATFDKLAPGVFYNVELSSRDKNGNEGKETIDNFSTSKDDLPPKISQVKTNSTIFNEKSDKIQTVISWVTNEPATTRIFYQIGVHGSDKELKESTELQNSYTKKHTILVTDFKSGVVYSFRVESVDSGGNITMSNTNTFMTPKKQESIIDMIIRILENTFGWVRKLKR